MPESLSRTALYETHVRAGARMVPFAGWEMPVQYAGIVAEHGAVRSSWGVFDVSHMGRIDLSGPGAAVLLDSLLTVDIAGLRVGRARYGMLCLDDGGILDDVIVVRRDDRRYLLVCNAANRSAVGEWLARHVGGDEGVAIEDRTRQTAMLAVQGPLAGTNLERSLGHPITDLKRFTGAEIDWQGDPALVTRTGYTGEDGYEVIIAGDSAPALWDALIDQGAAPCGLGARDTLRLEAGLPLHGNDIDRSTNPLEAGLERFVRLEGASFVGRDALVRAQAQGLKRRLAGFRALERGPVPRSGHPIVHQSKTVGRVTSGSYSPCLKTNIGMGYVPADLARSGGSLTVSVRDAAVAVELVDLPFYRRTPS
ncbi:MAG: glycine cleavage system aminomethyltransferase GcvT [Chloroflexi bacterium]|nr:glycine cleavage system aminomethyltransferase GcvT [Chloroflexota bacterium]